MRFNPQAFKIKQPISRGLVLAVLVLAASVTAAVYYAFAASAAREHAAALEKKLTVAEGDLARKTKALADSEGTCKDRLRTLQTTSDTDIAALNEKIAAFAKQAAACEVLRKKIGR